MWSTPNLTEAHSLAQHAAASWFPAVIMWLGTALPLLPSIFREHHALLLTQKKDPKPRFKVQVLLTHTAFTPQKIRSHRPNCHRSEPICANPEVCSTPAASGGSSGNSRIGQIKRHRRELSRQRTSALWTI